MWFYLLVVFVSGYAIGHMRGRVEGYAAALEEVKELLPKWVAR